MLRFAWSRARNSHLFYFVLLFAAYVQPSIPFQKRKGRMEKRHWLSLSLSHTHTHKTHILVGSNCILASFYFFVSTLMPWIEGISCKWRMPILYYSYVVYRWNERMGMRSLKWPNYYMHIEVAIEMEMEITMDELKAHFDCFVHSLFSPSHSLCYQCHAYNAALIRSPSDRIGNIRTKSKFHDSVHINFLLYGWYRIQYIGCLERRRKKTRLKKVAKGMTRCLKLTTINEPKWTSHTIDR